MNLWTTLERAARLHPRARALVEGDRTQTYVETRDRAARLASFLSSRGVAAGDRVAVLAWNGIDFYEIYYAAAACGAILVPLNVRLSSAEQAEVLDDCGARLVFAEVEFAEVAKAIVGHALDRACVASSLKERDAENECGAQNELSTQTVRDADNARKAEEKRGVGNNHGVAEEHEVEAAHRLSEVDAAHSVRGVRSPIESIVWLRRSKSMRPAALACSELDYETVIESAAADGSVRAYESLPARPDDVAHLYYTSGTTGRSKGVMLTHGNVGIHALAAIGELSLTERDTWAHIAPMFHLADAWATFAITWAGGMHVFLPRFEARAALDILERERVTITNLVPTMLNLMVKHRDARAVSARDDELAPSARARDTDEPCTARSRGVETPSNVRSSLALQPDPNRQAPGSIATRPRDWSSLRLMLSGGAPIAPDVVRRILDTFGCEYVQTYGMTETSPYLTLSLLKERLKSLPPEQQIAYRCKTGRPFATIELKVVDELGAEVAADERAVGEIWVRGPTVTPGYWRRPEETHAAFHDGWLKTGDLAVLDSEGYVTIVDRKKDMIITGGEKVYSIEVEHVLYAHPSVLECAVFGVPDEVWSESVRAAVVLREGMQTTEVELREFCRARIAGYKVPSSFRFMSELPRTGSGKIQKQRLR